MEMRTFTHEYRMQRWSGIISERNESGKTIRAWCGERGVSEKSYYYWQHKFREAASVQAAGLPSAQTPVPSGWASLSVREESENTNGLVVEVGGCRIRVQADTDTALLTRVCQALKTL